MVVSTYESIKIYEADSESAALDIIKKNHINKLHNQDDDREFVIKSIDSKVCTFYV